MTLVINISSEQRKLLLDLIREYIPGVEVWAYGSRVKWTARPNSDLDLVAFAAANQHGKVSELKDSLAESDLPFLVDLHIWDTVPERFHDTIRREHVILQAATGGDDRATGSAITFEWKPFSSIFSEPQKNGLTRPKASRSVGLPMVNMGELFAFPRILPMQMDRVLVNDKERSFVLKDGDLLFARQSLVFSGAGKCSIFISNSEPTVFESHIIRCRLNPDIANPLFYYYFFQSPLGRDAISSIVEQGASAAGIRASDLAKLYVPVPEVSFQTQTSSTLDALDQRIESLQRTNEHLEAIANAVFKLWFVDFGPVRAKAEGREPESMDAATAALFSDALITSELGEIPRGWTVTRFDEAVTVTSGGTPKTTREDFWGGEIPWFSIADAPSPSEVFVIDTEKTITHAGLESCAARLLPVGATIISARGTVGKLAITGAEMAINQSCYALLPNLMGSFATYFHTARLVDVLRQRSHGAVFSTITRETLASVSIVTPDQPVALAFERMVEPLMHRILINRQIAKTLSELRDTLLPRLISGKLCLPEAEKLVEAAS